MLYEYCVIGNGLIGASVALELARKSQSVCVLGAGYGDQGKYYSSHEDDSRIARCWHSDPYWERLTRRNFEKLEDLTAATGIEVFRPAPVLYRYPSGVAPVTASLRPRDLNDRIKLAHSFNFADDYGGIIEPKLYITALNHEARRLGATIVCCVVEDVCWKQGKAIISVNSGTFESRRVVDVRGMLFPQREFQIEAGVIGKILLYAESRGQVQDGPFCFFDCGPQAEAFSDVYGICNYRFRVDATISKFGFSERLPVRLSGPRQIAAWFQTDYHQYPYLEAAMSVVDTLYSGKTCQTYIKPCAFAVTPDNRPVFVADEQHAAIAGCNGMAAKCCQALAESFVNQWGI